MQEARLALGCRVKAALIGRGLQAPPAFVAKATDLACLLQAQRGVVLVGPSGAGKTCCLQAVQVSVSTHLQWHACVLGSTAFRDQLE